MCSQGNAATRNAQGNGLPLGAANARSQRRRRTRDQGRVVQDELCQVEACLPLVAACVALEQVDGQTQRDVRARLRLLREVAGALSVYVRLVAPLVCHARHLLVLSQSVLRALIRHRRRCLHSTHRGGQEQRRVPLHQRFINFLFVALSCQDDVLQCAPAVAEAAVNCQVANWVLLQSLRVFQQTEMLHIRRSRRKG